MKTLLIENNLLLASNLIKEGKLVAFPTETVFGLGADFKNENAVLKIFKVKKRPKFDPLIVHIADRNMIFKLWKNFPDIYLKLIDKFWPGPLTIIWKKQEIVHDVITAGLSTVGIRMPSHKIANEFIRLSNTAVCAPSANLFGKVSPTHWEHVMSEFNGKISAIIKGYSDIGIESTVVRFVDDKLLILRPGFITIEDLRYIYPHTYMANELDRKHSPGHFKKHYAPNVKTILYNGWESLDKLLKKYKNKDIFVISFKNNYNMKNQIILSKDGDLKEAAKNLFKSLKKAENSNCDLLLVEIVPEYGIGIAINDRLKKASAK